MPRNPRHPRLLLNRALRISRRHGIAVENVSPRAPAERGTQPIPLATPGAVPRGIRFSVFTRNMALQAIFAWQTLFAGASVASLRRSLPCSRETWPSRPFSLGKHCLLVRASHPCDAVFCVHAKHGPPGHFRLANTVCWCERRILATQSSVFTRNMALQAIFAWQTLFAGASVASLRRSLLCSRETWPSRPFSLGKHCLLVRASHPCDAVFPLAWDTFSNVSERNKVLGVNGTKLRL